MFLNKIHLTKAQFIELPVSVTRYICMDIIRVPMLMTYIFRSGFVLEKHGLL